MQRYHILSLVIRAFIFSPFPNHFQFLSIFSSLSTDRFSSLPLSCLLSTYSPLILCLPNCLHFSLILPYLRVSYLQHISLPVLNFPYLTQGTVFFHHSHLNFVFVLLPLSVSFSCVLSSPPKKNVFADILFFYFTLFWRFLSSFPTPISNLPNSSLYLLFTVLAFFPTPFSYLFFLCIFTVESLFLPVFAPPSILSLFTSSLHRFTFLTLSPSILCAFSFSSSSSSRRFNFLSFVQYIRPI